MLTFLFSHESKFLIKKFYLFILRWHSEGKDIRVVISEQWMCVEIFMAFGFVAFSYILYL